MIGVELWRARIGLYRAGAGGLKEKEEKGGGSARCAVFLAALLLLVSGDVETNPGPNSTKTRQSTLTRQNSIVAGPSSPVKSSQMEAPTTASKIDEVLSVVKTLATKFEDMTKKLASIEGSVGELREEMTKSNERYDQLNDQITALEERNHNLESNLSEMERKFDDMEARSRRNNLVFHGIEPQSNQESWADCEKTVKKMMSEKLGIHVASVEIERAHRLHATRDQRTAPIIVKFASFKDRENVLRQKHKMKGTKCYINEDFTLRVRKIQKSLVPFMKEERRKGNRANIVYDHININRLRYDLDERNNTLRPHHNKTVDTRRDSVAQSPQQSGQASTQRDPSEINSA